MLPLSISQQKSTAKQSAYMPMIQEIQKKWAKDQRRQQEEMAKLQQEYGYSPTSGCLPLVIQMVVMFGLVDVIYKPMKHILQISAEVIASATEVATNMGITLSNYSPQTGVIQAIKQNPAAFSSVMDADTIAKVSGFNQTFLGLDLSVVPQVALNIFILIPILSAISSILLQLVTQKLNGTSEQMQGSMKYMSIMSAGMMLWIGFSVPAGVTMYWIIGNLYGILQAFVLNKVYNPKEYRAQLEAEIAEKKAAKKAKKKVKVTNDAGEEEEKEVSEAELNRLRLEKAREMDKSMYDE